jgi:hypothetical protein
LLVGKGYGKTGFNFLCVHSKRLFARVMPLFFVINNTQKLHFTPRVCPGSVKSVRARNTCFPCRGVWIR